MFSTKYHSPVDKDFHVSASLLPSRFYFYFFKRICPQETNAASALVSVQGVLVSDALLFHLSLPSCLLCLLLHLAGTVARKENWDKRRRDEQLCGRPVQAVRRTRNTLCFSVMMWLATFQLVTTARPRQCGKSDMWSAVSLGVFSSAV